MKIYEYIVRIKDEATDKLRRLSNVGGSIRNTFSRLGTGVMNFGRQLSSVGGNILSFLGLNSMLIRTLGPAALVASFALAGQHALSLAADLEQTKVGFEVMLGSAEKAHKMIKDIRQFAKVTPFETTDLVRSTEILLGFGVAGEQIMPTIKMLGDVARGNADKLRLVSLAYAQIQAAGRLMGQDLLQLVNAGFNPLQEISRKTGRSLRDLKKDMEEGNISAGMVTAAFQSATSEGGRFFNMMNRQSATFSGMLSTVKDEWAEMLTSLGEKLLPTAIVMLKVFRSLLTDLTRINFDPLLSVFRDTWNLVRDVYNIFAELLRLMGVSVTQVNLLQVAVSGLALAFRISTFIFRGILTGFKLYIEAVSTAIDMTKGFGMIMEGIFTQNVGLIKIGFDQASKAFSSGFEKVKNEIAAFASNEYDGFKAIFTSGPKPLAEAATNNFGSLSGGGSGNGSLDDGIDKITGGGRTPVNVTINIDELIGIKGLKVEQMKEGIEKMEEQVMDVLLRAVNSANYAAAQ